MSNIRDIDHKEWPVISLCAWATVITMLCLAIFGENGYLDLAKNYRVRQELETKIEEIKKKNESLLAKIRALKNTDGKEVERLARVNLGMVRDGETVYLLESYVDPSISEM